MLRPPALLGKELVLARTVFCSRKNLGQKKEEKKKIKPRAASSPENPCLPWWGTGAAVRGVSSRVASGTEEKKQEFLENITMNYAPNF